MASFDMDGYSYEISSMADVIMRAVNKLNSQSTPAAETTAPEPACDLEEEFNDIFHNAYPGDITINIETNQTENIHADPDLEAERMHYSLSSDIPNRNPIDLKRLDQLVRLIYGEKTFAHIKITRTDHEEVNDSKRMFNSIFGSHQTNNSSETEDNASDDVKSSNGSYSNVPETESAEQCRERLARAMNRAMAAVQRNSAYGLTMPSTYPMDTSYTEFYLKQLSNDTKKIKKILKKIAKRLK